MPDPNFWQQEAERLTQRVLELEDERETQDRVAKSTWERWGVAYDRIKKRAEELAHKDEPPPAEHARIVKLAHQNSIVYAVLNQIWHSKLSWGSGLVRMVETLAGVNEEMLKRLVDAEQRKPPPPLVIHVDPEQIREVLRQMQIEANQSAQAFLLGLEDGKEHPYGGDSDRQRAGSALTYQDGGDRTRRG